MPNETEETHDPFDQLRGVMNQPALPALLFTVLIALASVALTLWG